MGTHVKILLSHLVLGTHSVIHTLADKGVGTEWIPVLTYPYTQVRWDHSYVCTQCPPWVFIFSSINTRPIATLCVFRGGYLFFYGIGCGNWFPYLLCSAMVFTRLNQSFDLHRVETFAAKLRNPEPVLF